MLPRGEGKGLRGGEGKGKGGGEKVVGRREVRGGIYIA